MASRKKAAPKVKRTCSVCAERGVKGAKAKGHNARSHEPGGRLAR